MGKEFFIDRVDGKAKVTGAAKFSAEYDIPGMVYGVLAESTITKGTITAMDTRTAENAPGVLAVITHLNCPKLPGYESTASDIAKLPVTRRGFRVFTDNIIRFNNQPIALVVADTFERATYAASLVKASYEKQEHHTDLVDAIKNGQPLTEGNSFKEYIRGEADAWKNAEVRIEGEYSMPLETHNPMEMHQVTVNWESPEKVLVYQKTQALSLEQGAIMRAFGLKQENVRIISQFVGGAFGSAFTTWPHTIAALVGAKKVGKPLKLMLTRPEMFTMVGYRPRNIQKISIGCLADGKLKGITHEAFAVTSSFREFTEGIVNGSRSLYNSPNVNTKYKVYPLDIGEPAPMRGPGEATGAFALEIAMDEMAHALKMDPVDFRIKNYSETDLENNKPYSSKFLKEAYQLGMDRIKWQERNPVLGSMKEDGWQVGYGMGTGIFAARRSEARIVAIFSADGILTLQSGVTDMGPGTATTMTKLASDVFGIDPSRIRFEMGDSNLVAVPIQGGSTTTSQLGTVLQKNF